MHGGGAAPVYAGGSGPGAPAKDVDAAVEEAAALVAALKVIEDDDVASRDPRSHTPHLPLQVNADRTIIRFVDDGDNY